MSTAENHTIEDSGKTDQPGGPPAKDRIMILSVLILFFVLTVAALWHHGYWGIFHSQFQSYGTFQVLVDLVLALSLILIWMWHDARHTHRAFWPWAILTLVAGSFGPLLYLLFQKPTRSGDLP